MIVDDAYVSGSWNVSETLSPVLRVRMYVCACACACVCVRVRVRVHVRVFSSVPLYPLRFCRV